MRRALFFFFLLDWLVPIPGDIPRRCFRPCYITLMEQASHRKSRKSADTLVQQTLEKQAI